MVTSSVRWSLVAMSLMLITSGVHAEDRDTSASGTRQAYHEDNLPIAEIQAFAEAFERIKQGYVTSVSDQSLLTGAIRGMVEQLDPHSSYLDKNELADLRTETDGEFSGIGIEVGTERNQLSIASVIKNTPASRAGLLPHDLVIAIDGTLTSSLGIDASIEKLRGEDGTKVTLEIHRPDQKGVRKITLTRTRIHTPSVEWQRLSDNIGYIGISQFQTGTGDEVHKALDELRKKSPLEGIVLDLRDNPGGVLDEAVNVSGLFIRSGMVVSTKGRVDGSDQRYEVDGKPIDTNTPMVILINDGTASAAEIVSGALQDHHRAVIMGTRSFGKASVQTVLPLSDGGALKLTTARYYTPDNRSIQNNGIAPDIVVTPAKVTSESQDYLPRESDLARHLNNPDEAPAASNTNLPTTTQPEKLSTPQPTASTSTTSTRASENNATGNGKKSEGTDKSNNAVHTDDSPVDNGQGANSIDSDYQLREAVNLLVGMRVLDRLTSK